MLKKISVFAARKGEFSWWWFGVKIGAIAALLVWWWLDQQEKLNLDALKSAGESPEDQEIPLPEEDVLPSEVETPAETEAPAGEAAAPVMEDDLSKIEGIGPKIAATLQAAGIRTYAQVAAQTPEALKQILVDGGVRIGYPETWPEQATLAARGDWDALEALQSTLKGGRRMA